jgi:hypothetical protein
MLMKKLNELCDTYEAEENNEDEKMFILQIFAKLVASGNKFDTNGIVLMLNEFFSMQRILKPTLKRCLILLLSFFSGYETSLNLNNNTIELIISKETAFQFEEMFPCAVRNWSRVELENKCRDYLDVKSSVNQALSSENNDRKDDNNNEVNDENKILNNQTIFQQMYNTICDALCKIKNLGEFIEFAYTELKQLLKTIFDTLCSIQFNIGQDFFNMLLQNLKNWLLESGSTVFKTICNVSLSIQKCASIVIERIKDFLRPVCEKICNGLKQSYKGLKDTCVSSLQKNWDILKNLNAVTINSFLRLCDDVGLFVKTHQKEILIGILVLLVVIYGLHFAMSIEFVGFSPFKVKNCIRVLMNSLKNFVPNHQTLKKIIRVKSVSILLMFIRESKF